MTVEGLWQLFPISLVEHKRTREDQYEKTGAGSLSQCRPVKPEGFARLRLPGGRSDDSDE